MRRYLAYSLTLHSGIFLAITFAFRPDATSQLPQTYTIDFIGPGGISVPGPPAKKAAAKKKPRKTAAKKETDEIVVGKKGGKAVPPKSKPAPLPRPSILDSDEPVEESPASEGPPGQGPPTTPGGGTNVVTDFPNFPYPWYITQVRSGLWNEWSRRMPRGGAWDCVVAFEIRRNGAISRLLVEKSSGNSLYDYAALASVQTAAPFPPLPERYKEKTLRVHVNFRTAP